MATFTTSDGVEIRFEQRGTGPPVYVCHGGPNNICDTLMRDLEPLADAYRLVFHDYRGSGQSGAAPDATYRFERLADDLDELRRHLGDEHLAILAHSMGGFVALHAALQHASSCRSLVFVGTTPCGVARPMLWPTLRALGALRMLKATAASARFLVWWSWHAESPARTAAMYAPMSITQEPRRELRARVAAAHPELPVENPNSDALMQELGTLDLRDELPSIGCPALVLYGSRDAVMVAGGHMLESGLPDVAVRVLPDVGHEPFVEAPDEAFALVRCFLDRTTTSPSS